MKLLAKNTIKLYLINRIPSGSFLLFTLLLLFFLFLFLNDSSGHSEPIIFLEILILVLVPSDKQVRLRLLELIQEGIADDGDLGDVQELKLRKALNDRIDAELGDLLALDDLDVLQVGHDFHQSAHLRVPNRCTIDL